MAAVPPQKRKQVRRQAARAEKKATRPVAVEHQGRLVQDIDRLSLDTERRVVGLYDRHRRGELDEERFVRTSATTVNRANAKATITADQVTAADLRRQTGRPHRPAGIKPIDDQQRLEKSIRKINNSRPLTATTPGEVEESRRRRLGRLARNEPATAAQNTTEKALEHHQGVIEGWVRAIGGSLVCPLCQTWADGVVRSTKVHMVRHKGCRCMQRPVAKKPRRKVPVGRRKPPLTTAALLQQARAPGISAADVAVYAGSSLATQAAAKGVTRLYGRRRVLAGGRRAFQRLQGLEALLKIAGPPLAKAIADRRRRILDGDDVDRNTRDLAILEGEFLSNADVHGFLDDLVESEYSSEELGALWNYAGVHKVDDPRAYLSKGPVIRFHRKIRRGEPLTDDEARTLELVDQAIARNTTKREATVWRGAILPDDQVAELLAARPGDRVVDSPPIFAGLTESRAFPHAARSEFGDQAQFFEGHHGVMFRMVVPEGMPAMPSPYGLALTAPGRLPGLIRTFLPPGVSDIVGLTGGRRLPLPIGLLPDWIPLPRALRRQYIPVRVPFLDYFNREELVFPRNTAMRVVGTKIRDDGLVQVDVELIKPTLSPPLPLRAGKIQASIDEPRDIPDIVEEIRNSLPATEIALPATTPLHAEQIAQGIRRMYLRYPVLAAKLERFLVTEDIPRTTGPGGTTTPPAMLPHSVLGLSGPGGPLGQRFTILNPWFTSDETFLRDVLTARPEAFAMRDMEGVTIHELGHHVFFALTDEIQRVLDRRYRDAGRPIWPDPGDAGGYEFALNHLRTLQIVDNDLDQIVRAVTGHPINSVEGMAAIKKHISGYAHDIGTDGKVVVEELVSEALAQVMLGKYRRTGATVAELFQTEEPSALAKAIVKYIDDNLTALGRLVQADVEPGWQPPDLTGGFAARAGRLPDRPPKLSVATPTVRGQRLLRPSEGPALHPDMIPDADVKKVVARQAKVPGFEDLARRTGRDTLEEIIRRQVGHILEAAERSWLLSPEAAELHAQWYPRAHRWLSDLADANPNNGITRQGAHAVTAALSPRADWANNVAWAKRVIEAISEDVVVQAEWIDAAFDVERKKGRKLGRGAGAPKRRADLIGKRLSEIAKDEDVAYALRAWHDHEPLHQLGGQFGFGDPELVASPNDMGNIVKAVQVARDGSVENIDRVLGGMKVRSFYNNLANPFDDVDLNVTIDTHHYGAANGIPWVARSAPMSSGVDNITETPWNSEAGIGGTYTLVVEATRRAAAIFNDRHGTNFLPNQLQSIVWEHWRAEFPSSHRTDELLARIGAIRTARAKGRLTPEEEARLVEAARLASRAPTLREILIWFKDDLTGQPRKKLSDLRPKPKGRRRR